jgi:hypothetical protein
MRTQMLGVESACRWERNIRNRSVGHDIRGKEEKMRIELDCCYFSRKDFRFYGRPAVLDEGRQLEKGRQYRSHKYVFKCVLNLI